MASTSRRTFLGAAGAAGAGALAATWPQPIGGRGAVGMGASAPAGLAGGDLDALAEIVRRTPRDELLARAQALHDEGIHWRDLLGAAFLAGVHDVEPHPVGFQFHCVLMTHSAFRIAAAVPAEERLAAAWFQLDDFKVSQRRDGELGDWSLPAAPEVGGALATDAGAAAAALGEALAAWDRAAADRAATALARCGSLAEAFEPLWWYGARDFTNIGHNPIFVAQAHRTLQEIGWRHGEPVLRSLARGLLDGRPGAADATFEANRERAARLAAEAAPGRGGPRPSAQAARELLAELRRTDPDGAAAAAAELLRAGAVGPLLDGLRLFAVEQLWRDPGILAVHALTAVNALRHAAEQARSPRARAMALLQAASWQVLYRDFLARQPSYDGAAPGIEAIEPAGEGTAAAAFERAHEDPQGAAALALGAARDGIAELASAVRHWLVRKVREHHDYKFAAALLEEAALADPALAPRLVAASLGYLRTPGDPDAAVWSALRQGR